MTSRYKSGILGMSVVLCSVFTSWPKFAQLCLLHSCEVEPLIEGTLSALIPHTVVQKSSDRLHSLATPKHFYVTESIWKDGIVHSAFIGKLSCGNKARISGHMTDALQIYTFAYKEHISITIFLYAECKCCYVTLFIKDSLNR